MQVYTLIGLFKNENFSYGRAVISDNYLTSFVSTRIASELRCRERLDEVFKVELPGIGSVDIDSVCSVDRAVVGGGVIDKPAVFYIVSDEALKKLGCDIILGIDVITWWSIAIDMLSGRVYSRDAKPVDFARR